MYAVYDRTFGDFLAKNTVCTPFIYGSGQPYKHFKTHARTLEVVLRLTHPVPTQDVRKQLLFVNTKHPKTHARTLEVVLRLTHIHPVPTKGVRKQLVVSSNVREHLGIQPAHKICVHEELICMKGTSAQVFAISWLSAAMRGNTWEHMITGVGQNLVYTPYMTVYLVISLLKIPYVHHIYMVLADPNHQQNMVCTGK